MSDVKTPTRRARAEQTRLRIIRAAHDEFCAAGYHGATMAAIAKHAGVAVQTVYFVFHTKPELLTATFDNAVMGEDATPPEASPWFAAATTGPDLRASVAAFVAGNADISARVAKLHDVTRVASLTDPDLERIRAERERWRRRGYGEFVRSLSDRGVLRSDLDVSAATDVAMTILGPDTYLAFVDAHGWSHERYLAWMTDAAAALLLSPDEATRPRPDR